MTSLPLLSTYRLQMRGDAFTFADAVAIVDYLDGLGISHVYLSPLLTATTGSNHGYDVVDPSTVSPALGGRAGFEHLVREVRSRGMGVIVDIVPNHVGVGDPRQNAWWWDVLRRGRDSAYASFFDIDWSEDNGADGRIALPVLGSADAVQELTVDRTGDEPVLAYYDKRFPIAPGTDDGTRGRNPCTPGVPAGALGFGVDRIPALLHRGRSGRGAGRGPAGVRCGARPGRVVDRRRPRRRPAGRPSRRSRRSVGVSASACAP